jgi:hypothetical protein
MKTKEFKIQIPEGYEIDKENSTFECIKFKSIKKNITYGDICEYLFKDKDSFYITNSGGVNNYLSVCSAMDKNNATNREQLKRILALNQLLNIAEYYNRLHIMIDRPYVILYDKRTQSYTVNSVSPCYGFGIEAAFNKVEDAKAVRDNPNFREILDTIYK